MKSRDLLARLTLALTATSVPLAACGGETIQSTGPGVTAAGGGGGQSGGGSTAGGTGSTAGTGGTISGKGGTAGAAGSGTGATAGSGGVGGLDCSLVDCYSPPCPEGTEVIAKGPGCCPTLTCRTIGQPTCPSFVPTGTPACTDASGCVTLDGCGTGNGGTGGAGATGGTGGTGGTAGKGGGAGGSAGGATCNRPLPAQGGQGFGEACRTVSDCPPGGFGQCLRPDEPLCAGGGGAPEPSCTDDASCGGQGYVCQDRETGGKGCAIACTTDQSCGASQRCETTTGHCVARNCDVGGAACPGESFCSEGKCAYQQCNAARPCGTGLDCSPKTFQCEPRECDTTDQGSCPDTFTCLALSSQPKQICVRSTCTCDTQCGASGFCLGGTCYESAGTCSGNIACGRPLLLDDGVRVSRLIVGASDWS